MISEQRHHLPWQARLPFFYGWVIVVASLIFSFTGAGLFWGASVFVTPMQEELGWSRTAIYLAFTIRGLIGIVISPLIGPAADKAGGARRLAIGSGLVASLALLFLNGVTEEWQFMLLFGVFGGIGNWGQAFPTNNALVPKWFVRKRGIVIGWASMGSPIAAMGLAPLMALVIDAYGWRTSWTILGIASLVLTVLPALLLIRQPEDIGLLPDGERPRDAASPARMPPIREPSATPREALTDRMFWVLMIGIAIGGLSYTGLPASLVPMMSDRGLPRDLAVLSFSLYGLCSMLGRFFWGYFANRYPIRIVIIAMCLYGILVTPLFSILPGGLVLTYSGLVGFVIGGSVALTPLVWPAYYGRTHIGAISGYARPATIVVQSIGPIMMAQCFDQTGSYDLALWLTTISWAVCAVTMWGIRPKVATGS
jgi:MFS family permease